MENLDSLKKQFSECKMNSILKQIVLCLFLFFLILFIPAKQKTENKKLDLIPLPHGVYILVGETDINQLCHHIKVPGGVENK